MNKVCAHCGAPVIPIVIPKHKDGREARVIGKGEVPTWRHDPQDRNANCGQSGLREGDVTDAPDESVQT